MKTFNMDSTVGAGVNTRHGNSGKPDNVIALSIFCFMGTKINNLNK